MLYSEIKEEFNKLFDSGEYPKTLTFSGKSAYVWDLKDVVINVMFKRIDNNLKSKEMTPYQDSENRRTKKRLIDILEALKDKSNWDIDLEQWREDNCFSSYKFSGQSNLAPLY